jgi:hypothetical protein
VNLSARGLRDMDGGEERIGDKEELAQVRKQARKVHLKSFFSAVAATIVIVLLP